MIAALFVETDGCYFGLDGIDPWDITRDARKYAGPHPVVAHPPCERWGRYAEGAPNKPKQYRIGDDQGKFAAALWAVRTFGGVLEHPAHSKAWKWYGLKEPSEQVTWCKADAYGWTCHVEQGHYGHMARKKTWLYAVTKTLPELNWTIGEQRLHPVALAKHGYEKARRIGMTAMVGGKDKKKIRERSPTPFRDVLIFIAEGTQS